MGSYSQRVHLLSRRLRLLIGAQILVAVASAVVAVIAAQEASPLRPAFALGGPAVHSYVATKNQWETANNAHAVAWASGTLALALFLSALTTWVVARWGARTPRNPA